MLIGCWWCTVVGDMRTALTHPPVRSKLRRSRHQADLTLDEAGRRARIERSRLSRAERGYLVLHDDELARLERVLIEASAKAGNGGSR